MDDHHEEDPPEPLPSEEYEKDDSDSEDGLLVSEAADSFSAQAESYRPRSKTTTNAGAILSSRKRAPMMTKSHRSLSTTQLPFPGLGSAAHGHIAPPQTPFWLYATRDFVYDLRNCPPDRVYGDRSFSKQLLDSWNGAKARKVYNYELNSMYKLLDGDYNLSVQLNIERGTLRRKPMRFRSIREPFSHLRWNFTKLKPDEMLFSVRCLDKPISTLPNSGDEDESAETLICVNASPIERGHVLICPEVNRCLPQLMNKSAVRVAVDFMLLIEDDTFHVLFNSLLGQASVNHLHIHGVLWPYESDLINRRFKKLARDVYVIERPDWYIGTFAFQLSSSDQYSAFVDNIYNCTEFLTRENIAHNMFFSRAQPIRTTGDRYSEDRAGVLPQLVTAYLFPRHSLTGAKPSTGFNPASLELAGCLTAYNWRFFESISETTALRVVEEEAVLEDGVFSRIRHAIAQRLNGVKKWSDTVPDLVQKPAEFLSTNEMEELADSFQAVTSPSPLRHHISLNDGRRNSHE